MDCGGMLWMRLPGQSWPGAAAHFLLMWAPMMALMMLPVLAPMLWRYRQALDRAAAARPNRLTVVAAAGYFLVWSTLGAAVFPLGAVLMEAAMRWPALAHAAPLAAALVVLCGGVLQFSAWKARRLACCRERPGRVGTYAGAAWRQGLRMGLRCVLCCLEPTAALLALGVMDLGAMAAVTVAISAERLASCGTRVARGFGAVAVAVGALLVLRAA